ncbi:MAG: metal-dependent hydrolase [Kiritimatiellae bacterium]|nr:metal-dependent hydrolase [Kiritimatiellia bacterium]
MKAEHHLAVSLTTAAAIYAATRSAPLIGSFLVAGVLLDLDHWVDYWAEYGRRFDVRHFFESVSHKEFRKAFLFLHAWEWVALCGLLAWWRNWNPWLSGLTLGWGLHLLLDQLCNSTRPWTYFLLWRAFGRFEYKRSFPVPYVPRRTGRS